MDQDQLANQPKEVPEEVCSDAEGHGSTSSCSIDWSDSSETKKEASGDLPGCGDDNGLQSTEEVLLKLTEKAADAIKSITAAESMPPNCRLRVKVVGGGCSGFSYDMVFDERSEEGSGERPRLVPAVAGDPVNFGDRVVESYGVQLVIDEMSLMYIVGTEIDYVEELSGTGFKFNNPSVKTTCGCGSSFSV